jgi:hypothetical protein
LIFCRKAARIGCRNIRIDLGDYQAMLQLLRVETLL